ncbi:NAD(P)/FAD-dependent oxidoreductase [Acuticoccus mangrovi]|uniref:FAD-binding oxidoreductase n=1 Tax=Acuticoccus mangrovi TaxID=2796142 RepID=A0A934IDS6_9HYPH|nr:FAD-binding oxidoreductase [Acuticoccus mangrovi]MBJ3774709.1 FAD-binding oxidoreductase [Acuticoccus mangrovi]
MMNRVLGRPPRPDKALAGVHWAAQSREPHVPRPTLDDDLDVDIAVVGGGFSGLSIARAAAATGARVAVFEAGRIGNGASGRNAGFAVPHFAGAIRVSDVVRWLGKKKGEALATLVTEGPSRVMETVRRYQIACDAEQNGWIQPAHSNDSLAKIRAAYEDWRAFGAPVDWLDGEGIRAAIGSTTYVGGWQRANGATVNPTALVRGIARAAANEGVLLFEESPASHVAQEEGGRPILTVNGHRVRARRLALATNGYTEPLVGKEARALVPIQLFHTMTEPLSEEMRGWLLPGRACFTDIRKSGGFGRYDRDGRLLSGGLVFAPSATRRTGERHAYRRMRDIFPNIGHPPLVAYWTGWCAATDNHIPRIQRLGPNIFSLAGYATRGVCLSQMTGAALGAVMGEGAALDDLPLEVHEGPAVIPWHRLKAAGAQLIFPWLSAMDRMGFS